MSLSVKNSEIDQNLAKLWTREQCLISDSPSTGTAGKKINNKKSKSLSVESEFV